MFTLRVAHKDQERGLKPFEVQYIEASEVALRRHDKIDEDDVIWFRRSDGTEDTLSGGHVLIINSHGKAIDTYHFKNIAGRCRI